MDIVNLMPARKQAKVSRLKIAPLALGAIAGGLGLLGGAMTNSANAQINRENNEFQLKMWNLQNEYNLPINMRKRLVQGGFNPQLAVPGSFQNAAGPVNVQNRPPIQDIVSPAVQAGMSGIMNAEQVQNMQTQLEP